MNIIGKYLVLPLILSWSVMALAFEPFAPVAIDFEGVSEHHATEMLKSLPIKVGSEVTDSDINQVVKILYQTNLFADVSVFKGNKGHLIIKLTRSQVISNITTEGLNSTNKDLVTKYMKDKGLVKGEVYVASVVQGVREYIKDLVEESGSQNATVKVVEDKVGANDVGLTFEVKDGPIVKVKSVFVVGNDGFSRDAIMKEMQVKPTRVWSFITSSNSYSKAKLANDLDAIQRAYAKRGYIQAQVKATKKYLNKKMTRVDITIHINEGDRYVFGDMKVDSKTPDALSIQRDINKIVKNGEVFNPEKSMAVRRKIVEHFANKGYLFAGVSLTPEVNRVSHIVDFIVSVTPNQPVYVRRIKFAGDVVTHDEVMRHRLIIAENQLIKLDDLLESQRRLANLGYLRNLRIKLSLPSSGIEIPLERIGDLGDYADVSLVDIEFGVEEFSSTTATAQVGYSNVDKLTYGLSYNEKNVLGTGRKFGVAVTKSRDHKSFGVTYGNPNWYNRDIATDFSLNLNEDKSAPGQGSYNVSSQGVGFDAGYAISLYNNISFGLHFNNLDVKTGENFWANDLAGKYDEVIAKLSYSYSNLDQAVFPNKGSVQSAGFSYTLPIGSESRFLKYYISSFSFTNYVPVLGQTFQLGAKLDLGGSYDSSSDELPFFKRYFIGGTGSLRGFDSGSIGAKVDAATKKAIGGSVRLINTFNWYPSFAQGKDYRWGFFLDNAGVWESGSSASFDTMRSSMGVSVVWRTPIAPFVISYGVPINKKDGDNVQSFQISLGFGG